MKAVILAGGFSTRLHPLTRHTPKGLLPLLGKPMASYVLDGVVAAKELSGITLVTTSLFYPQFDAFCRETYGNRISVIQNGVMTEHTRLGALGDLSFALSQTGWKDDILVATSDTVSSLSLPDFISFFQTRRAPTTVVFKTPSRALITNRLGCAILEGDRVASFFEKPKRPASSFIGVPFYIFPKESLALIRDYLAEGHPKDAPGAIIPWLITKGPVYGYRMKGYYHDVGTVATYEELNEKGSFRQASS
jgi:glucose-1-phosphate thymidylyltransferase